MNRNFRHASVALLCLALSLSAIGCGQASNSNAGSGEGGDANIKTGVKPEADAQAAVIDTDFGRIVIELYPNVAPQMVARFKKLAGEGFYNGTAIHRIDPELGIIQGGDPNSKDANPENDGMGSSNEPNLPAEFSDLPYERGTVGAARAQSNDSANCQFYITLKRQPAFDQKYTVFGRVIEGINNADIISTAPIADGTQDRPADKILVKSITLAPRSNFK
ncbi:MAG TPA: peptidylprolyl isomerase [Pyrinomonadaceae bacterium]|nr:peptidylprolyl isomerase [Pyrinomonadaceae bacterium]